MINKPLRCFTKAACLALALLAGAGTEAVSGKSGSDPAAASWEKRTPHQYVYIVYFNPADRECLKNYQERLDRVMSKIQKWYRDEMVRNGFGPMTFPLERDRKGKLVIHVVNSKRSYDFGEEITTKEMRDNNVKPAMLKKGIDIDQEHIILFANTVFIKKRKDGFAYHSSSHYCGGGGHRSGTAWVTDSPCLDPLNLPKKKPMIYDGGVRPYTLGNYVVTYMGGVAHEFGHSLGLPHNMETEAQFEELGYALMGSGNYHLFGKSAGQEKESYLSEPHATILSSHPLFKGDAIDIDVDPECTYRELEFTSGEGEYTIKGRVEAVPRAYAVVAYHDLMQHRIDYDSTSWVGKVDKEGRFEVRVGALKPGWYEMRLRCFMVNGAHHELRYRYTLDHTLKLPAHKLERQTVYESYARPAIEKRDPEALLAAIDRLKDFNDIYFRRARAHYRVMTRTPAPQRNLSAIGLDVHELPLTSVKWESAEVGWEGPKYDSIGRATPLESGEQFHERGIYAHADSRYVYHLEGKWKKFTSGYGLQNLAEGSVIFIVKCDGEERFRSGMMTDWVEGRVEIDVTGCKKLELIVTDGGNGKWADCGVWFSPMLFR